MARELRHLEALAARARVSMFAMLACRGLSAEASAATAERRVSCFAPGVAVQPAQVSGSRAEVALEA